MSGTALRNRISSFVIDGEAVLLGVDGVSDFDGLHSRQHDEEAALCLRRSGDGRRRSPGLSGRVVSDGAGTFQAMVPAETKGGSSLEDDVPDWDEEDYSRSYISS
jgi:hypothetical protein